jgi:hypothetical protein
MLGPRDRRVGVLAELLDRLERRLERGGFLLLSLDLLLDLRELHLRREPPGPWREAS